MNSLKIVDSNGNNIDVSIIGFFNVPELEKEYVMYGLMDDDSNNDDGHVMLGEVVRDGENIQILGILSDEKDLVVAYYNEISNQIGEEING